MCICFWTCSHPAYAFVLASARDEYYQRPTTRPSWRSLPNGTQILCGIDLEAKGTWLAIARTGRFALLTNFTEPLNPTPKPSRGALVMDFLQRQEPFNAACQAFAASHDLLAFAGFNLLVGDVTPGACTFAVFSNRPDPTAPQDVLFCTDVPQTGTMGNGHYRTHLQQDDWGKARRGLDHFERSVASSKVDGIGAEALYDVMTTVDGRWNDQDPVATFKETVCITPCRFLKPAAHNPDGISRGWYGNRCQTLIMVGHDGQVVFKERETWAIKDGSETPQWTGDEVAFSFKLEQ